MKHPTPIPLKEFRSKIMEIIDRIRDGESFLVMKRSKPVFRVLPSIDTEWEIIQDFTKEKHGGINIDDLISRI